MELSLKASDSEDMKLLRESIINLGYKGSDRDATYRLIADVLLRNIAKLDLDEDLYNLTRFAVGLTSEISPLLLSRESLGTQHWAWRPVYTKLAGTNSLGSDIRPQTKQVAAMMRALSVQLTRDPLYAAGAGALERYITRNQLWTAEDEGNVEF
ncbi:hypothetical protein RBA41_02335 [Massilia sp. CCM 9210]|uniref:hypothetical protein n=1 Tax=Massilia scottii TaxID=3057166 RepID=UPI002796C20E|nr:hypothetical protein [Massilia sp. CCM 9210]MDQ1812131.1 hypothetical protein [Massilia sp. CCM 9210]